MEQMTVRTRLRLLVPAGFVVGAGLAYGAMALYYASRGNLPGTFGSDARDPLIGMFVFKYWYTWLAIAAGWVGFAYLAFRALVGRRPDRARDVRPFKIVLRTEVLSAVGTFAAFALLMRILYSDGY
jgi:hypothetical protein